MRCNVEVILPAVFDVGPASPWHWVSASRWLCGGLNVQSVVTHELKEFDDGWTVEGSSQMKTKRSHSAPFLDVPEVRESLPLLTEHMQPDAGMIVVKVWTQSCRTKKSPLNWGWLLGFSNFVRSLTALGAQCWHHVAFSNWFFIYLFCMRYFLYYIVF